MKHLSIWENAHFDVSQTVNKIRPDLESLQILMHYFHANNTVTPLRFANMKIIKCNLHGHIDRIPFEFGNLEEVVFDHMHLADNWIDIMMQNKKLKSVTALTTLRHDHLERIASGLPNLGEFTMKYEVYEPKIIQHSIDFLKTANQLKEATFLNLQTNECEEMARQLNKGWENVENRWKICRFVRKKFYLNFNGLLLLVD